MSLWIDALAWIYVRDRRVLGVRTRGRDAFYLPGGKREPGESDWEAIAREVQEELNVALDPLTFSFFGKFDAPAHGHGVGARVTLICYEGLYRGVLAPANEIAEMAWLGYGDRDRCAPASQMAMDLLRQQERLAD